MVHQLTRTEEYMHQVTVIEPKWLSEVAPTFFRIADQNKISKRKASEKIEPLFDRFATDKDDWVSTTWHRWSSRTLTSVSVSANKNELPELRRRLDNGVLPLYSYHRSIYALLTEVFWHSAVLHCHDIEISKFAALGFHPTNSLSAN
jgi:hypothetical protein